MKKGIRFWILVIVLLVLSGLLVEAAIGDVFGNVRDGFGNVRSGFGNITDNIKDPIFRYMFIAIGLVTYYYLNKNNLLGLENNKGLMIGICVFIGYFIANWRMATDGWVAYMYILLVCLTLKTRNSSGEGDKVAGVDSGLMYMVAAGVLAPFSSIAAGTPIQQAFLTHFGIGLGVTVIYTPLKKAALGEKRMEEGKGWLDLFRKGKKKDEEIDKAQDERIDKYEDEIKHQEEIIEDMARNVKALEEKQTEVSKNPGVMEPRQDMGQYTQTQVNPGYGLPPMGSGVNAQQVANRVNHTNNFIREKIAVLENDEKYQKTQKGKTIRLVIGILRRVNERTRSNTYNTGYWGKVMGDGLDDDSRLRHWFGKVCETKEDFIDILKRLDKVKQTGEHFKGVITPEDFVHKFAKELIRDYKEDREWSLKTLKKTLSEMEHTGTDVVNSASSVEHSFERVNKMIEEENKTSKVTNNYYITVKDNNQKLMDPNLPLEEVDKINKENPVIIKAIEGAIEKRLDQDKDIGKFVKNVIEKQMKEYQKKKKENSKGINVYSLESLDHASENKGEIKEFVEGAIPPSGNTGNSSEEDLLYQGLTEEQKKELKKREMELAERKGGTSTVAKAK